MSWISLYLTQSECQMRSGHETEKWLDQRICFSGAVETDPEYRLIVEANNIAADIDNEILTIHKFVKEKYQKRFPELESLVVGALEYVKTVKELGNDLDQAKNNEILQQFVTQATIMVVSVTASTTQGLYLLPHYLFASKVIGVKNYVRTLNFCISVMWRLNYYTI